MEKTITLKITGMHCASCGMNIDGELEDKGAKESTTSYAKAETKIVFDESKVSLQQILESIKTLGYDAKVVS